MNLAASIAGWGRRVLNAAWSFESARRKLSDADFMPPRAGPNAELETPGSFGGTSAESIAAAVNYELNNNELLDAGVEMHIDAVVRTGITLVEPRTGDDLLNAQIRELWEMACARADVARLKSLGELQALYVRECRRAGEVFVRTSWAPEITVGGVPMPAGPAIELIPSERVPRTLSGIVPEDLPGAGDRVRGGIEINADGQVVAVWVLKDHPDDSSPWFSSAFAGSGFQQFKSGAIERVPIAEITPRFYARRAAQMRGISPLCSVLNTVRQERSYTESAMRTAHLCASLGVIGSAKDAAAFAKANPPMLIDGAGNPVTTMGRGAQFFFTQQDPDKLKVIAPSVIGPAFEGVYQTMTRRMSRVLRRTPSQVSGNYGDTNFAGARMAQLDNSRSDERDQADVWAMTTPFYRAVINTGLARGQLQVSKETLARWQKSPSGFERIYAVSVTAPGAGYANPEQEARANASDIATGIKSRVEACQERGVRYTDVIEESIMYEVAWRNARAKAGLPEQALDGAAAVATAAPTDGGRDARPTQEQDKGGRDARPTQGQDRGGRDARPTQEEDGGKGTGRNLKIAGGTP